jgi:hypothetical protein
MKGNFKNISRSIALALGITMLSPLNAAVHIITNHDKPKSDVATFSQFGVSNEKAEVRGGFGEDMPLETAIEIIIPDGWKVTTNDSAMEDEVEWEGGVTWPYILEDLSARNDISVSINWNDRTIDMFSHKAENDRLALVKEQGEINNLFVEAQQDVENEIALKKETELREQYEIEKKMLEREIQDKKDAEVSNMEYIASLEGEKDQLIQMGDELSTLVEEKNNIINKKEEVLNELTSSNDTLNSELKELRFDNVGSNTEDFIEVDIAAIKKDYSGRFILPIDDSFDFYYQGGYEEEYDYYSPATYLAKSNITLQDNLEKWANGIGWSIEWKTSVRYPIKYPVKFEGTFKESSIKLVNLYRQSKRPLDIDFYPDSKVVVVTDLNHKIKNKK